MRRTSRIAASAAMAIAASAATLSLAAGNAAAAQAHDYGYGLGQAGAVYVQNDGTSGNAVAVYDRSWDGTLTAAGTYATGGDGGILAGSVADHLGSQNSLVYDADAQQLFAVNAGSDTISSFDVQGDHLRLRQVIGSGGSFPVSIATHGNLVYALNALDGGSIQGYWDFGGRLVPIPGSNRQLGLNPNATPQFVQTPGDIAFSPDGRSLLVTTKANGDAIDVFAVAPDGAPSSSPVVNDEPNAVPFALAFGPGGQLDVGEAGTDAVASFSVGADGTLTPLDSLGTGGAATCWLVADGPVLFAGNAGSATESSVLAAPGGGLTLTATTGTDPGTIDAAVAPDGRYLYVQTGGKGIVDEFRVGFAGALQEIGSVTVPGTAGGEGIAAS